MLSKSIGTNIKAFRTQKGLSQEELAASLFVTRQTISNYETGKSFPDIDTLQKIASVLEVELTWLLYGKPSSSKRKADVKTTVIMAVIFAAALIITMPLLKYTDTLKHNTLNAIPNILVRLILLPVCSVLLGGLLLQMIDCFFGINKPKNTAQKIGWITTVCVLGVNLIIVLPYLIWCVTIFIQMLSGHDSISAVFPNIPVYKSVAFFFIELMYSAPYVYVLAGAALWLFRPRKKERSKNEV